MCLTEKLPIKTNGIGYKWVVKCGDVYYAPNIYPDKIPYSSNEVNIAKDMRPDDKNDEWGFHIFNNLHEAKISRWGKLPYGLDANPVLLQVEYNKIRFTGIGTGLGMIHDINQDEPYEIIVAEEMTIIEEVG